jgi:hypothetical protein
VEVIRPSIATYNDRGGTALVPAQAQPRTAEGPRERLDQFHLRVGRLPVPQLPDRGV